MFRYPDIPRREKQIEVHPYQRLIKEKYIPQLRYYHNSVRNPKHPEKKERLQNANRTTFTVFGDMKSKEFLYSLNMVEGLHKYRWKLFDKPVIKGVTSIEWPQLLRSLKLKYGPEVYCLQGPTVILMNGKLLGGQQHLKAVIENNYHYYMNLDYPTLSKQQFIDRIKESGHTCVFMHIDIENEFIGTLIFELFDDKVPKTCQNFTRLCRDTKGGYSGTPVHRIVTDGWIQCGGFGLKSVPMDCENFIVKHDRRGLLCMANAERHIDCSTQFFVLLQPASWMDKKYVAFGQLIDGEETLKEIEAVPTWYESPLLKVIICKAGVLNLDYQDLEIYTGTKEYIEGHIENLSNLEDYLFELILRALWLALEYKEVVSKYHARHGEEHVDPEEHHEGADGLSKIHTTKRFIYNKSQTQSPKGKITSLDQDMYSAPESGGSENKDIDVEEYGEAYEEEEEHSPYTHVSIVDETLPEKPYRPFYIPLTDVPCFDEKASTYDLKKFLDGEFCLESDVVQTSHKVMLPEKISYQSEVMTFSSDNQDSTNDDQKSIGSNEEKEVKDYLKGNVDRFCFAGGVIKKIAKGVAMTNFFDGTGDDARSGKSYGSPKAVPGSPKNGLGSPSPSTMSTKSDKRVSVFAPPQAQWREDHPSSYRRRPTGIRPQDFEKIKVTVKSTPSDSGSLLTTMKKLQEGFSKSQRDPSKDGPTSNALSKLFEKALCDYDGDAPALKDHMPKHLLPEKSLKIREHRENPPSLAGDTTSMRSMTRRKVSPENRRGRSISFTAVSTSFPKTMKPMSVEQYQEMNKTRLMQKAMEEGTKDI